MKQTKNVIKSNNLFFKNNSGITLIALVITIIVLLILAGVSIAMLTGQNGILTQAQNAKNTTEEAQGEEANALTSYEQIINASTGVSLGTITGNEKTNTVTQDSLGNRVVVPAGFKVVNPNDNVEDGIIIEDVSHGATAGSQFVWIPVGTGIKRKGGTTFDVTLGRYDFDSTTGNIIGAHGGSDSEDTVEEHNKDNTPAKDIEEFRKNSIKNGGYYIGRYEARTATRRTSGEDKLTQITEKPDDYVYNYVSQLQAAELSRNMYNDSNFTSDLVNSYAWDTAIVFIQSCSGDNRYSQQSSLNQSFEPKGTVGTGTTEDVKCNIYDMASNCYEKTTETSGNPSIPCIYRGGDWYNTTHITCGRYRI